MIKAIIFDYDGVIVESANDAFDIYTKIFEELKIENKPKTLKEFKKIYGLTHHELIKNMCIEEKDLNKIDEKFKKETYKIQPKPFPKIKEVLEELHQKYKLVIVSSNFTDHIKDNLKIFGLYNFFDLIKGVEDSSSPFSKDKALTQVINELGLKNEEVVFLGDMEMDCISGKKAKIDNTIPVTYGWDTEEKFKKYNPKILVNSPTEILDVINKLDGDI